MRKGSGKKQNRQPVSSEGKKGITGTKQAARICYGAYFRRTRNV